MIEHLDKRGITDGVPFSNKSNVASVIDKPDSIVAGNGQLTKDSAPQQPKSPNPLESITLAPSESKSTETQTKAAQTLSINLTTQVISPSFDCAKVSPGSEHIICSNANHAAVDVEMAQVYKKVFKNTTDTKTLKREQNQWRKARRDACKDVACLLNVYAVRIKQLNEQQTK